jgi:hypothetical protein
MYQISKQFVPVPKMNRVVWEVVNDYAKCNPNLTIQQIKKLFSSVNTNPPPCVEEWSVAIRHTTIDGRPDKRYFDKDPDDKIKVFDGYVTVSTEWRDNPSGNGPYDDNFKKFCALAKTLGYIIS